MEDPAEAKVLQDAPSKTSAEFVSPSGEANKSSEPAKLAQQEAPRTEPGPGPGQGLGPGPGSHLALPSSGSMLSLFHRRSNSKDESSGQPQVKVATSVRASIRSARLPEPGINKTHNLIGFADALQEEEYWKAIKEAEEFENDDSRPKPPLPPVDPTETMDSFTTLVPVPLPHMEPPAMQEVDEDELTTMEAFLENGGDPMVVEPKQGWTHHEEFRDDEFNDNACVTSPVERQRPVAHQAGNMGQGHGSPTACLAHAHGDGPDSLAMTELPGSSVGMPGCIS